jgi:hypothetical protein
MRHDRVGDAGNNAGAECTAGSNGLFDGTVAASALLIRGENGMRGLVHRGAVRDAILRNEFRCCLRVPTPPRAACARCRQNAVVLLGLRPYERTGVSPLPSGALQQGADRSGSLWISRSRSTSTVARARSGPPRIPPRAPLGGPLLATTASKWVLLSQKESNGWPGSRQGLVSLHSRAIIRIAKRS